MKFVIKRLIVFFTLFSLDGLVMAGPTNAEALKLLSCEYTLRANETISQVVSKLVSSSKNFPLQTYGESGWLDVTERLNGKDLNKDDLEPGFNFSILVPESQVSAHKNRLTRCIDIYYLVRTSQKPDKDNIAELTANIELAGTLKESDLIADFASLKELMPAKKRRKTWFFLMRFQEMIKEVNPIVSNPKEPPILPETEIPTPLITEKPITTEELTDEKIADLPQEDIENIAPEVLEEKASEISFLDSLKPGMDNLFKGLNRKTAAGLAGLRVGYPMVVEASLLSKLISIGLLVELRGDTLKGLRYGYDFFPKAENKNEGVNEKFTYSRHSLGWAFEIPVNYYINQIHIIPRIGSYSADSVLGALLDDNSFGPRSFKIKNGLALGWEFDVEKAAYFWILRGWVAQDVSGKSLGIAKQDSVSSMKVGFDASVKGGRFSLFGGHVSTSYLAFLANESINLVGEDQENGNFLIKFEVPRFGLGVGLTW